MFPCLFFFFQIRVVVPDHLELTVLAVSADMPSKYGGAAGSGSDGAGDGMAGWGSGAAQVQQAVE